MDRVRHSPTQEELGSRREGRQERERSKYYNKFPKGEEEAGTLSD